jgi:hypothetical protein
MNQKVSTLLTVLISVAVAVPTALLLQGSPDVVVREGATPDDPARLARLAQLEKRIQELAEQGQTLRVPIHEGGEERAGLDRIAALEKRVAALERARRGRREPASVPPRQPADPDLEARLRVVREQGRARVLDPKLSDKEKVRAHEALRQVPDAYTPAMVQELVRIGTSHQDAHIRADVWRFFDGRSQIPALVPSLLQALVNDSSEEVRDEASETLGNYLKDPTVLFALRHAAQHDTSMRVRRKAIRTLQQNNLADAQKK